MFSEKSGDKKISLHTYMAVAVALHWTQCLCGIPFTFI